MSADKRKRSVNFSADEKMRFLRILQKKGHVIISKVTSHDLQTNRYKEDAWSEITNDLNASGSVLRTTDNLKKLWQKMKTEAKTFKSLAYNQTYGTGGGPSKKFDDPVLELVAEITGRGSSGIELVNDCDSEILYTNALHPSTPEPYIKSPATPSTGLYMVKPKTPPLTPPVIVVQHSASPSDEVASYIEVYKEKEAVENVTPKSISNLKRRWPTLDHNNERTTSKSSRVSLNNNFASERLKSEKEKQALIELQKQHMAVEHALKIKHAEIKTKILEAVLKKVQDEKPVDSELLKIMSNL